LDGETATRDVAPDQAPLERAVPLVNGVGIDDRLDFASAPPQVVVFNITETDDGGRRL
jgi:hypothetical protein